jgi:hypothetical protein
MQIIILQNKGVLTTPLNNQSSTIIITKNNKLKNNIFYFFTLQKHIKRHDLHNIDYNVNTQSFIRLHLY